MGKDIDKGHVLRAALTGRTGWSECSNLAAENKDQWGREAA